MQDAARFFAYSTWAIMVSVAIILFTHGFLDYVAEPGWVGTIVLLAFGFLYLNLAYAAVKRYIRKVPVPTNTHWVLTFLIWLPPAIWIIASAEYLQTTDLLLLLVTALSCGLGAFYGNRAGIKARYEYIQALKEHREKLEAEKK